MLAEPVAAVLPEMACVRSAICWAADSPLGRARSVCRRARPGRLGQRLAKNAGRVDNVRTDEIEIISLRADGTAPATVGDSPVLGTRAGRANVVRVIDWVDVAAGPGRYRNRLVTTPAFRIARTPLTQRQFAAFAEEPGVDRWFEGLAVPDEGRRVSPATFPGPDRPQDGVSWFAAVAFCRWASARAGGPTDLDRVLDWPVRLPTDREWEKAARGDGRDAYPYGPAFRPECGNGKHSGLAGTSPVGSFPEGASPYGLLDMSGNVWEWTASRYDDPDGALVSVDLRGSEPRLIRGGCYANAPGHLKATYRGKASPGATFEILGLRVCTSRP